MGRRSKLTDDQWALIEGRYLAGESRRSLAKEFGIGESAIREHKTPQHGNRKIVLIQTVGADPVVIIAPISSQVTVHFRAAHD